jgi:calcineurin-like phosphoesterase family protein
METFVTSDTHFKHRFLADLRGFGRENLDQHDEAMLQSLHDVVGPKDRLLILGDLSFGSRTYNPELFPKLPGAEKHFWVGNHDPSGVVKLPWDSVNTLSEMEIDGHQFVLCHFPLLTWHNAHKGVFHLHGHTHGNLDPRVMSSRMDVGIDAHPERRPWSIDEIIEVLSQRPYDYVDHHTEESAAREAGSGGGWGFKGATL